MNEGSFATSWRKTAVVCLRLKMRRHMRRRRKANAMRSVKTEGEKVSNGSSCPPEPCSSSVPLPSSLPTPAMCSVRLLPCPDVSFSGLKR